MKATDAEHREMLEMARKIVKATMSPDTHNLQGCHEKIDAGEWDNSPRVRGALAGLERGVDLVRKGPPLGQRCNTCRFWLEDMSVRDPNDINGGYGSCRLRPPVLLDCIVKPLMPQLSYGQLTDPDMDPLELVSATRFPATQATDWCGQYQAPSGD